MKPQTPYRYSILRYMHDVRTEEFLNVAILLHAPESRLMKFRAIEKTGRLSGAFPGMDSHAFLRSLERYAQEFARFEKASPAETIEHARSAVLPKDDSSFQWGPTAGGVSADVREALDSVFHRYVGRYEKKHQKRVRSDTDVWHSLKTELDKRHVTSRLHRTTITTPLRAYQFAHSWQNHQLHALKPFSLDGESMDVIADKAAQWVGVMHDLSRSKEQFQLHVVVGKPQHIEMENSYANARDLLKECANGQTVVHDESEIPQLADRIARDVESQTDK